MRLLLFFVLLALPGWAAPAEWTGSVGPNATVWLTFDRGTFRLTFEERWEEVRRANATGSYDWDGELLEFQVEGVTFDGHGADSRDPRSGFIIDTPRKSVMDQPTPSLVLRPGAYIRLRAVEDDNLLELRGNGGLELNLSR